MRFESHDGIAFVAGDRGAGQWFYTRTDEGGRVHRVDGCDLDEFGGDRIRIKDAYRRVHGASGGTRAATSSPSSPASWWGTTRTSTPIEGFERRLAGGVGWGRIEVVH